MIPRKQVFFSLTVALIHFAVCGILAAIVIPGSFGYAMYAYQSPAGWFVIADHALLLMEAPVAVVLYWIYHPAASFEPPHYFVADFLNGPNFMLILGLCALWSLAFGCLALFVKHCIWPPL